MNRRMLRSFAGILLGVGIVYAAVYVDVILRARTAFLEGEKYWAWHQNPSLKAEALDRQWRQELAALERQRARGEISPDDFRAQKDIAESNYQRRQRESAIKYAYIWYQTVVELFSPPESRWVRMARAKMPQAKELWKQELTARGIPFEDYMLD